MNPIIEEIMRLSGAMPDPHKHRRYLETLEEPMLEARARALRDEGKPAVTVEFWPRKKNAALEAIL